MAIKSRISFLKASVSYFAILIVMSACSELLTENQFFSQGSSGGVYIKPPDQKIFRTGEVAIFRVQFQGKILKSHLTKKNIKLQGRDLKGCETEVVNGNTVTPQIHVYGCETLSNDLNFVLSGNIYTKLNGTEPNVRLESDEMIFDNSIPFEFKVEVDQNRTLYLPALNNEDRHFRVDWGDGNVTFFREGLNKDKLFHVYKQSGIYDVSISGNFKNFYSSRFSIIQDLDGTWNKGEKASISFTSKIKPPILVDIGGMEQKWIEEETDKIEIKINHENISVITVESADLSRKHIKSVENTGEFYTPSTLCSNFSFGPRATTLRSVKELGSIGWRNMAGLFCNAENLREVSGGNTSQVTDMSYMFRGAYQAVPDTSGWVTSNVTSMAQMFRYAYQAEPVTTTNMSTGVWDTSKVTNMSHMFKDAQKATPDTSGWKTSKVTSMYAMFTNAHVAEPDTKGWDTSNVRDMTYMFQSAWKANPNVSKWVTSKVKNMSNMFSSAKVADPDVSNWDTSNVTRMTYMFANTEKANPDVSKWNVSNVKSMIRMFSGAQVANPDVSKWDTSSVESFSYMFISAQAANPVVEDWDVGAAVNMEGMFAGCLNCNLNVSKWDVSKVRDFSDMFRFLSYNPVGLSNWNMTSGEDFSKMFSGTQSLDYDFSNFNFAGAKSIYGIFHNTRYSTKTYSSFLIELDKSGRFPFGNKEEEKGGDKGAVYSPSKYNTEAQEARERLIEKGWIIEDGGLDS